jgi:hypothetical protein
MWFDPHAALAEIEGRPHANPADRPRGAAGQFAGFAGFATPPAPQPEAGPERAPDHTRAGFAGFAGIRRAEGRENACQHRGLRLDSQDSQDSQHPPTAQSAPPLDPEGLPFAACPTCGGCLWWKDASLPLAGPGWACDACDPPPADLWRHACAVPVGAAHDAPHAGHGAVFIGGNAAPPMRL